MTFISAAAPQFLVANLRDSIAFYEAKLGFTTDFVYGEFYAGLSRGGAILHLKCASRLEGERAHRKEGQHLDAYLVVEGLDELHAEFVARGAPVLGPPTVRPWGTVDFSLEDPDGYILCFSQAR